MYWTPNENDKGRLDRDIETLNLRTVTDLNHLILENLSKFQDIDWVVGVPRSGLLAATPLALQLNAPLLPLDDFLARRFQQRHTVRRGRRHQLIESGHHGLLKVLIVDDTCFTGKRFDEVRADVAACALNNEFDIKYLAAYCHPAVTSKTDLLLEVLPTPRIFEWTLLHQPRHTPFFCVDLDGVLCADPTPQDEDDGPHYAHFCLNASPKFLPTSTIGAIVTARLERFRQETEAWLNDHGVSYNRLIMCNLPSRSERRRLEAPAKMKADVYRTLGGSLFIESELHQARAIHALTDKPVFCFGHGLID